MVMRNSSKNSGVYRYYRHDNLDPICDENTHILIVGSFPPCINDENPDYYKDSTNCMKDILKKACGISSADNVDAGFFKDHGIGFFDIVDSCYTSDFRDSHIIAPVINDQLIKAINKNDIKVIVVTGNLAWKLFCKIAHSLKQTKIIYKIPSTSGRSRQFDRINVDEIASTLKLFIRRK